MGRGMVFFAVEYYTNYIISRLHPKISSSFRINSYKGRFN